MSTGEDDPAGQLWFKTAHNYVRSVLREEIVSGRLAGGEELVQKHVAARLGVSTTPVREAFRDLEGEGLLKLDPHRRAVIRDIDPNDVADIYEIRMALEPLAIEKAARRRSEEGLERAREVLARLETATDNLWAELNQDFHLTLIRECGNERLCEVLVNLHEAARLSVRLSTYLRPDDAARAQEEHKKILDAVSAQDERLARQLTVEHLEDIWQTLQHAIGRSASRTKT